MTISQTADRSPGVSPATRLKKNRYIWLRLKILLAMLRKRKLNIRKLVNGVHCLLAYQFKLQKSGKAPFLMNFELWNECNANCLFCRDEKGQIYDQNPDGAGCPIPKGKMPVELYEEILDQVKGHLMMAVLYINGEPLMYPDLYRAIRYATERRVATMIATNGTLLNEQRTQQLLDAGIDCVKIAVSGFTQEKHGIQVRQGNIEKIKENIRNFVRMNKEGGYGAVIMVDYMLYKYNEEEMPLFKQFCDELGVMMNLRPGHRKGVEDLEPPRPEVPLPVPRPCDWLWKVLSVNWNGDVLPCCDYVVWSGAEPYTRFVPGETDLLKLWNGEPVVKMRKIHKTVGRGAIPICAVCPREGTAFKM